MSCVIHHGPPGSFKSFGTIQRNAIPALIGKTEIDADGNEITVGRTVVTNIRGFNSLERIEQALDVQLHPDSKIIYVDADSEKGFDAMRHFFHWVPFGALIAMDETQIIYSKKRHRDLSRLDLRLTDADGERRDPELIKSESKYWDGDYERPETVERAFDQHRHYNWDIYCTTPNISKVHPEIREVVEIAYRHRGKGALLPWWRNKWVEFAHDAESSGKSISHYMGSPKPYTADKKVFECYQSTKTGKAVGTSEARPLYRDPKLQTVFGGIVLCFSAFIYYGVETYQNSPLFNRDVYTQQLGGSTSDDAGDVYIDNDGNRLVGNSARLASTFDSIDDPAPEPIATTENSIIDGVSGFIGDYVSKGFSVRLGAVLKRVSSDDILFRVIVFDGDQLIDTISQDDFEKMGYSYFYDSSGLIVQSDSDHFLIRRSGSLKLAVGAELGGSYATTTRAPKIASL